MARPRQSRSRLNGGKKPPRAQQKRAAPANASGHELAQPPGDRFASGYDVILANGDIDHRLFAGIVREISTKKKNNVVLCLVTYGGVANDAYRIGRALQISYDDFAIFIPSFCKSAGTLVACAANSIIMAPFGELGPLDVQILKKDELFDRRSGLITTYALAELKKISFEIFEHFMLNIKRRGQTISFKMASEIAAKVTSDIMENVYEQVNVDAIGEDTRNLLVASEYCKRLNKKFQNTTDLGIHKLVHGYLSHDFVIDFEDAAEIFKRVEIMSSTLSNLMQHYPREMMVPSSDGPIVKMLTDQNATVTVDGEPDAESDHGSEGAENVQTIEDAHPTEDAQTADDRPESDEPPEG